MKTKNVLLFSAILFVGLMSGCNKDTVMNSGVQPAVFSPGTSIEKSASLKPAVVNLGVAGDFVILSTSGITDVYPSVITGNIGTSPYSGTGILVACDEVTGTIYAVDAAYPDPTCTKVTEDASKLGIAVLDMGTAYGDAAGRFTSLPAATYLNLGAGSIGASTPPLAPGVYTWTSALAITGDITLKGKSTDVFIFQVNGTLDMASAASIILTGGAKASNIFWQVTGAVTLGTTSHFEGIILTAADSYIAMQTGASINGRLLAGTAVTLEMNAVTQPAQPVQNKGKGHK